MPLKLPKWLVGTERAAQGRTQRSRVSDQFEQDLREALKDLPYEVHGSVVMEDFLALTVEPEGDQGVLGREARKRADFAIIAQRSRSPVALIVLTNREYGRDRRRAPATASDAEIKNNSIIPVLHLNPYKTKGVAAITESLKPYL